MPTVRRRHLTLLGLVLVAGAFLAIIATTASGALVYYVTPTELAARAGTQEVRLYGVVVPGSVRWSPESQTLTFRVTDGTTDVAVDTRSIPTGLFREGIGVVLLGRPAGPGRFDAEELLIKHSEVYAPLAPGETVPPGLLDELRARATP